MLRCFYASFKNVTRTIYCGAPPVVVTAAVTLSVGPTIMYVPPEFTLIIDLPWTHVVAVVDPDLEVLSKVYVPTPLLGLVEIPMGPTEDILVS